MKIFSPHLDKYLMRCYFIVDVKRFTWSGGVIYAFENERYR